MKIDESSVAFDELVSNETIAVSAIEITAIPHASILQKRFSAVSNIDVAHKQDIVRLLSELFQNCKDGNNSGNTLSDASFEFLWITDKVDNQPFKAKIRLFLIIRTVNSNKNQAFSYIQTLLQTCKATLDSGKYEYTFISLAELFRYIDKIDDSRINAITKEEHIENLQNQVLPTCFSFHRLPVTENDLSRLINTLTDYPNSAVSFQLIPTTYDSQEIDVIDKTSLILNTLSRGVTTYDTGNISYSIAEKHAENYRYYSEHKNATLFSFNILVFGSVSSVNTISARILGQLNVSNELQLIPLTTNEVQKHDCFYPLPWVVNELLLDLKHNSTIWNSEQIGAANHRLSSIITAEEAAEFFRLPIGSENVSAGLNVNEFDKSYKTYSDNVIGGGDIIVGALKATTQADTIGITLKDLTKHMLIVGTPGSGKTTFSVSLLDRLWKEHNIPFLVIEPAKNEYRALVQSIPDLQVFTPGKNSISPFIFNPFVPPKNVKLETYKSTLKTAFGAAVSMSTPLDKIFEETINNCYSDFHWLDTYTSDDKGFTFNISDFIKCFEETFNDIGYTGDAKNIGQAGIVRLRSLTNLFDNYFSIPIEDLLAKPTILELAAIENSEQKALIISLLLLSILAYVNSNYVGDGNLRNVILLEEAHVLLAADTSVMQGEANPNAIAQGLVKRMLAEIRSYGVGMVIADQSPRKVTTDVVALTDIKLAFRLVETTDRQIIADSSNMSEIQTQRLAKLKTGEAFLFFGKLDTPEEIRTEDYRLENNINITLSDERIKALSTYWKMRKEYLRPYPECAYCQYCMNGCDYERRILSREIARRIFNKNFKRVDADLTIVKSVFSQIVRKIRQECNKERSDNKLLACVEIHLIRRIRYGTKINISSASIQATISNI